MLDNWLVSIKPLVSLLVGLRKVPFRRNLDQTFVLKCWAAGGWLPFKIRPDWTPWRFWCKQQEPCNWVPLFLVSCETAEILFIYTCTQHYLGSFWQFFEAGICEILLIIFKCNLSLIKDDHHSGEIPLLFPLWFSFLFIFVPLAFLTIISNST